MANTTFKGTTPTYTLTLPEEIDLSQASNVYVTFAKSNYAVIVQKDSDELEIVGNVVNVFLTQEETLRFPLGEVYLQLNWTYVENNISKRACSQIVTIKSARNLINEVIE